MTNQYKNIESNSKLFNQCLQVCLENLKYEFDEEFSQDPSEQACKIGNDMAVVLCDYFETLTLKEELILDEIDELYTDAEYVNLINTNQCSPEEFYIFENLESQEEGGFALQKLSLHNN